MIPTVCPECLDHAGRHEAHCRAGKLAAYAREVAASNARQYARWQRLVSASRA